MHLAAGKDLDSFKPYGWDVHNEDGDYLGVYSYNDVTGMGYVQSVSYGGGNKVKLPDGSYILPTLTITSTRYNLKTGFDPRAIREVSGGYDGDASALDIAATTVGAIGFELGALEAGWRLSSNKSQWSSAYKIHQSLKSSGINIKTSAIKNGIPTGLKATTRGLGYANLAISASEVFVDGEVKASHILNTSVAAISIIPGGGWVFGGVYFATDLIISGTTGQSISNHLDNVMGKPIYDLPW